MKKLNKKEFAELWGLDHSLPKDLWRTEVKKADQFCKWHTEGKGRGIGYFIDEIYDTPKERIHGNTGREPINKGQVDENSLKYKLALALVTNFAVEDETYAQNQPKRYFLELVGCHMYSFKHFEDMFWKKDLLPVDKFALKLGNNTSKSLNGLFHEAIKLVERGVFKGITLDEQLYFATFNHEHYEAYDEIEDLLDLYNEARSEAKIIVESEHGEMLFFSEKRHLINIEYRELIETEEKYKRLLDNQIDYFYSRYAFIGKLEKQDSVAYDYEALNYDGSDLSGDYESESIAEEFANEFLEHRNKLAVKAIERFLESGTIGIINKNELLPFAVDFTMLLFQLNEYETFVKKYNQLMVNVQNIENTGFQLAS
ncbi:hypothetical protein [Bacillus altitudinis]|uniref:hypothetical protein n=1 Tax=Bacillus altitudinis TaxID=293387 RepID=UPI00272A3B90|nr:hypothetical protein [Bacillus altitudinis]WLF29195.1 hypothetical protein Q6357_12270 [Bacillus altitudinis]